MASYLQVENINKAYGNKVGPVLVVQKIEPAEVPEEIVTSFY